MATCCASCKVWQRGPGWWASSVFINSGRHLLRSSTEQEWMPGLSRSCWGTRIWPQHCSTWKERMLGQRGAGSWLRLLSGSLAKIDDLSRCLISLSHDNKGYAKNAAGITLTKYSCCIRREPSPTRPWNQCCNYLEQTRTRYI